MAIATSVTVIANTPPPPATKPDQFQPADWRVLDAANNGGATIHLDTIPYDGGAPINAGWYTVNGGPAIALGGFTVGAYPITGLTVGVASNIAVYVSNTIDDGDPSVTEPVTPTAGSATLTIAVQQGPDNTFPHGVWFEASVTSMAVGAPTGGEFYDPRLHEIDYVWDFDEPGTFSAPTKLPTEHNDRDVAFTAKCGHVFQSAKTFTVRCTATDRNGLTATNTVNIPVTNPDTVYSGTDTICVSMVSGETWAGKPTGATEIEIDSYADAAATWAAAKAAYLSNGGGRLLVKRGDTIPITGNWKIDAGYSNCYIGAWGTGANPIFDSTVSSINTFWLKGANGPFTGTDVKFDGLHFQGGWDETALGGAGTQGLGNQTGVYLDVGAFSVMNNCTCDGMAGSAVYMVGSNTVVRTTRLFVNELVATSWGSGIPVFGGGMKTIGFLSLTGYSAVRSSLADGWYNNKGVWGNQHGTLRTIMQNIYVACADMFSKSDWGSNKGVDQPPIRHNTGNNENGAYSCYERIIAEGGNTFFQSKNAEGILQGHNHPANDIVQMCFWLANYGSGKAFNVGHGGTTLRNNIVVEPGGTNKVSSLDDFVNSEIHSTVQGDPANTAAPVRIYNNTFASLLSDSESGGTTLAIQNMDGYYTDVIEENNVLWSPNRTGANQHNGNSPLSSRDLLPVARYLGLIWWGAPALAAGTETNNGYALEYAVTSLTACTGTEIAHRDYYGAVRGVTPSKGAAEIGVV